MRSLAIPLCFVSLCSACGDDGATSSAGGGPGAGGASSAATSGAGGAVSASASSSASAGGAGGAGGEGGSAPILPCDFDATHPPPSSVLWPAQLSATGADTLGGHGHDDGKGAVGFCAGTPVAGEPYHRLVAVGLEVDVDLQNDGSDADDYLRVDFWRDPASFTGYGESGGRVNVYVEVVDENGNVLNVDSAPEIRIERTILGGPTELLPLTSKPSNEFQTNFNMVGGGARYGVALAGHGDRVINLRLPVNHHVSYVLVFRRELP